MQLVIIASARKHGVADEDIRHAVSQAMVVAPEADDVTMWLGSGRDGSMLEVATVEGRDFEGLIAIHAMPTKVPSFSEVMR